MAGLAQAVVGCSFRFGMGARIWLGEICESDNVDHTAALFSESTGRVLVSVGREDDVKFVGLCEARGIPVIRIGVTDNSGTLEIQEIANRNPGDLAYVHKGTLDELFV